MSIVKSQETAEKVSAYNGNGQLNERSIPKVIILHKFRAERRSIINGK